MNRHGKLCVERIVTGPLAENCYLVFDEETRDAILVDPGAEEQVLSRALEAQQVKLTLIVGTHAHVDHVGAAAPLLRQNGVALALHAHEKKWLSLLPAQADLLGLPPVEIPQVGRLLEDGEEILVGNRRAEVLHTPGHSAGGICLSFSEERVLLAGDTLFAGSVGRADLPGGSFEQLLAGIKARLLALPDETVVYCGHGPSTTIGAERRHNPYLRD